MNQRTSNVIPYETFFYLKFLQKSIDFYNRQDKELTYYKKQLDKEKRLYKEALEDIHNE